MDGPPLMEITAVELANFLEKKGFAEKAAGILTDFLSRDPRSASAKSVTALARIAYKNKKWREAAVLWRMLADSPVGDAEALLKCTHGLIELNQTSDAQKYHSKFLERVASERGRLNEDASDELLAGAYEQICLHFLNNDLAKAEKVLQLAARLPS